MAVKLGFEAIEYAIRKFMTKNTKGIASIPGQAMKDKIKILVDKYAKQISMSGKNVDNVTVKEVENAMDYGMALSTQRTKDEALKKFPKETHKFFGRPLKDEDFKEIDKLYPPKKDPFQGFTPKVVPKDIKNRMDKITGMSDQLKKMQAEKEAMFPGSRKKGFSMKEQLETKYPGIRVTGRENFGELNKIIDDYLKNKDVPEFASGGIAGELRLNRSGYAKGKEVIEKSILTGPDTAIPPDIKKILDVIGGGAGIATIGLPKWLMSKLMTGGVRSKIAQKYIQLAKENRFRDARQLLTAQDPYIGEDPEMSEAKRTFRKYSRRVPTEEEEEFRLSPEMIEEGWRYPGRGGRGVPHERTARNKRGYANGGLAQVLGV